MRTADKSRCEWHVNGVNAQHMSKVRDSDRGAHSFAQAHLVRQDAVEAILVEGDEPAHPSQLIVTHLTGYQRQHHLHATPTSGFGLAQMHSS